MFATFIEQVLSNDDILAVTEFSAKSMTVGNAPDDYDDEGYAISASMTVETWMTGTYIFRTALVDDQVQGWYLYSHSLTNKETS